MRINVATIALWHHRSLLSRADIFGPADPRPTPTSPAAQRQVDVAVPGMQGKDYAPGGVMLLTANPAGGKDDYNPSAADIALYGAYQAFARVGSHATFAEASALFADQMRAWRVYSQHIGPILQAAGATVDGIAYAYVVPFRVRDDSAAHIKGPAQRVAYQAGLEALLDALDPGLLVCLDRVSEGSAYRHADRRPECRVVYYTRKRDAHQQRREILRQISDQSPIERFGAGLSQR